MTTEQVRNLLAIGLEPPPVQFGREFAGCVVHGRDTLAHFYRDVIAFAIPYGFDPANGDEDEMAGYDMSKPYPERMEKVAGEAVAWLNAQDLVPDFVFAVIGEGRIRSLCYLHDWAAGVGITPIADVRGRGQFRTP